MNAPAQKFYGYFGLDVREDGNCEDTSHVYFVPSRSQRKL
jgi:hypothetical protein